MGRGDVAIFVTTRLVVLIREKGGMGVVVALLITTTVV